MTRREALKLGTMATAASAESSAFALRDTLENESLHSQEEICYLPAVDMLGLLRSKKLSAREVLAAHLKQIDRLNGRVNAIVTLAPEESLVAQAKKADEAI